MTDQAQEAQEAQEATVQMTHEECVEQFCAEFRALLTRFHAEVNVEVFGNATARMEVSMARQWDADGNVTFAGGDYDMGTWVNGDHV